VITWISKCAHTQNRQLNCYRGKPFEIDRSVQRGYRQTYIHSDEDLASPPSHLLAFAGSISKTFLNLLVFSRPYKVSSVCNSATRRSTREGGEREKNKNKNKNYAITAC
jgi:hypothetical protein